MHSLRQTLFAISAILFITPAALADKPCSNRAIAGKWVFATGIGHQNLGEPFPPNKDVTAIGTMNIGRDGTIDGKFDVTIQDFASIPNLVYTGTLTVNPDCTGTIVFVTSAGTARTDSIVVVSRREMLGMTQDPSNLWTYQVRRIVRGERGDHD